jgi:Holliday junction resolvase RusA-like endonuclease
MIALEVRGIPASKGSGRAILIGGRARHVPSGSSANQRALRAWDNAIKAACRANGPDAPISGAPIAVSLTFRFPRPRGHYGTGRNSDKIKTSAPLRPTTKPDVDKIARSTLDSLTGLAFDDDSRVVELTVKKWYARWDDDIGASILIEEWRP